MDAVSHDFIKVKTLVGQAGSSCLHVLDVFLLCFLDMMSLV